jgi:hypothetical protein
MEMRFEELEIPRALKIVELNDKELFELQQMGGVFGSSRVGEDFHIVASVYVDVYEKWKQSRER